MTETRLHTCNLCEAVCGVELDVEADRIVGVRGDRKDPFSKGHICPKAAALGDLAGDPDRVREPMRREGDRWSPVSWDSAIAEFVERVERVRKQHGPNAVAIYVGNPTVHSHTALLTFPFFAKALGARSKFSATSIDQLPHMLAALEMFGHQLMLPIPDIDRAERLWIMGANPWASNGSLLTAGNVRARIEAIRERGGRVTVFDPRRTETAEHADEHVFIRPGGDAFFLLGVLSTLFQEGLADPGAARAYVDGWDALRAAVAPFTAARVASRAGIAEETIVRLARELAGSKRSVVYGRMGVCTQEFGGLAAYLVNALNVAIGALDRMGGAMFPQPAVDLLGVSAAIGQKGHHGKFRSRVRGLPEFGGELPVATLAEEIDTPGEGQIRALVTLAGNPVLSTPNGARLARALPRLEFMASIDIYRNETTRHAHLLLPTSVGVERDHYDLAFYQLAVRNAARYAKAAVAAPSGVKHDFDLLTHLALALHASRTSAADRATALALRAARALGHRRLVDTLLRVGPYGTLRGGTLSLSALEAEPHGLDLGPLRPRLPSALWTRDKRVVLLPALFAKDLARVERALVEDESKPKGLVLVGRRQLRSNNSWMHNSLRLVKGPERCTLLVHPDDAAEHGVKTGDRVLLRSKTGEIRVLVEVSDEIHRGVVSLPHGWGHSDEAAKLEVARSHAGASINDVTDDGFVDPLSGTAAFSGVSVVISAG
ncbi:MAG: molybdopterin-dependent oxidoreductase [Myxococcales bacterium]|nr:molybdopterin-dependent oxidoreductase [Myxococcales bacterium]